MHVLQLADLATVPSTLQLRICFKSGKLLGKYHPQEIADAIAIHGSERTQTMLAMRYNSHCAIEWLQTDPTALDNLMENDPLGYYVYALSKMMGAFKGDVAEVMNKYTLRTKLNNSPIAAVIEINRRMREILSMGTPRLIVSYCGAIDITDATPDKLRHITGEIQRKLKNNQDLAEYRTQVEYLAKHGNFAAQRYLNRGMTTEDMILSSIELTAAEIPLLNIKAREQPKQRFTGVTLKGLRKNVSKASEQENASEASASTNAQGSAVGNGDS